MHAVILTCSTCLSVTVLLAPGRPEGCGRYQNLAQHRMTLPSASYPGAANLWSMTSTL